MAALHAERPKYVVLREICDRLEQLRALGAENLFWGEQGASAPAHLEEIQQRFVRYDERLTELQAKHARLGGEMRGVRGRLSAINDEILDLEEQEEEERYGFVIEREMRPRAFRPAVMPWFGDRDDERRYRRFLLAALLFSIVLGYLVPLWNLPVPEHEKVIEIPERLAKLIVEKELPPPPPKVTQELPRKENKEEKHPRKDVPKPKTEATKLARKKAESTGLLAFKENFAELMENPAEARLGAQAHVSNKGQHASKTERSLVVAKLGGSSGGIDTSQLSRNVGDAGSNIGDVAFSRVSSSIGDDYTGDDRPLSDGMGPSRTDEEIQIVFDRYKAALYRIYNRELRKNPLLQGKMVLRITIEPDGHVSLCKLESSDMHAPQLEAMIVERVRHFNFGPKEGVPVVTILYPIDFLPAS